MVMMIKKIFAGLAGLFQKLGEEDIQKNIYEEIEEKEDEKEDLEIYRLWDYLTFDENTQAYHITEVVGFDEWVNMHEIRRRIEELFGGEYKNKRSLYPYIKTLVDINLFETRSIGGRRKWRKKELLFKIDKKKAKKERERQISVS